MARKIEFVPAKLEGDTPLYIGLIGPSGGGKTLSSIRLAKGITSVRGGQVVFIDTEGKRALRYSKEYDFLHFDMQPPFSSKDYMEVMVEAAKVAGIGGVVIVDSMSHEHEGQGGYLDLHESILDRVAKNDYKKREKCTMMAWIEPSKNRQALINKFLQLQCSFIFCFRAKEKIKLVKGAKEPVQLGWQPIAGPAFAYEMTARCLLPPGANGVPDWSDEAFENDAAKVDKYNKDILRRNRQLDEAVGVELANSCAGEKKPDKAPTEKEIEKNTLENMKKCTEETELHQLYATLPEKLQTKMKKKFQDAAKNLGAEQTPSKEPEPEPTQNEAPKEEAVTEPESRPTEKPVQEPETSSEDDDEDFSFEEDDDIPPSEENISEPSEEEPVKEPEPTPKPEPEPDPPREMWEFSSNVEANIKKEVKEALSIPYSREKDPDNLLKKKHVARYTDKMYKDLTGDELLEVSSSLMHDINDDNIVT